LVWERQYLRPLSRLDRFSDCRLHISQQFQSRLSEVPLRRGEGFFADRPQAVTKGGGVGVVALRQ
jgi:hypothetical protein